MSGTGSTLDREMDRVTSSLVGVKAELRARAGARTETLSMSSGSSDSSEDSGSSEPDDPGKRCQSKSSNELPADQIGLPPIVKDQAINKRPQRDHKDGPKSTDPLVKQVTPPEPVTPAQVKAQSRRPATEPRVSDARNQVGLGSTGINGTPVVKVPVGPEKVEGTVRTGATVAKKEVLVDPIPKLSQARKWQQSSVAKGKKYGAIGERVNKLNNILKTSRLLQNSNPMVLKAQQALDYIMEIPGIQMAHIKVLLDQWEERFLALLYQYVRLHNRMEYAAESKKLACLATRGGTYKDARTFEQDLEIVKPDDVVELETPIMKVDHNQPFTSGTSKLGLAQQSESSRHRKAKKTRKLRLSGGLVTEVEPLQDN